MEREEAIVANSKRSMLTGFIIVSPSPFRGVVLLCLSVLLRLSTCCAFCPLGRQFMQQYHFSANYIDHDMITSQSKRRMTKVFQSCGGSGDYLSSLSSDQNQKSSDANNQTGNENNHQPATPEDTTSLSRGMDISKSSFQNAPFGVSNEMTSLSEEAGKITLSEIAASFSSIAEKGGSDLQSLARTAKRRANVVGRKGTLDLRRTSRAIGQSTGKGLKDFDLLGDVVRNLPPVVEASEVGRWIDNQAKSGAERVKSTSKSWVLNFTGKREYQFGDVSKELIRRIASSDISWSDAILLLKILLALGTLAGPLAELLPFAFLVRALNISVEEQVGGTIIGVLTKAVDNRLVASLFSGDDQSLIGDVAKRTVLKGVLVFTGKERYEAGDIERTIATQDERGSHDRTLDIEISSEFSDWDRIFIERTQTKEYQEDQARELDIKIAIALKECETLSQRANHG